MSSQRLTLATQFWRLAAMVIVGIASGQWSTVYGDPTVNAVPFLAESTETPDIISSPSSEWFAATPRDREVIPDHPPSPPVGLLDNLSLFGGLDGAKGPDDLGINANFGIRTALQGSYPVCERVGLGVQVGTALNYSLSAIKVLETIDGTHDRFQSFTTVGFFQRTAFGLSWGVAYDLLFMDYYANLDFGQWRAQIGYALSDNDEIGIWSARADYGASAAVGRTAFHLKPITQGNLYWRHTWSNQADTRFWVGVAQRHSKFVFVLPGDPPVHDAFVFGADLFVPLNRWIALFGEANFITPSDSGTVTATLGFAIYPGGKAVGATHNRFAPLLPVANNPSFAVDFDRQFRH
jgi:hypothetical protein